jgi:hypothetical protein
MSTPPTSFTTVNKVGLVLAALLGVGDIVSLLSPTPEGETGPPYGILVLSSVLGLVTVVAVVWAFRKLSRGAVRIVAATRIVSAITSLPAFFVDIPDALRLVTGVFVVLTVVVVVMILTPARRSELVLD